jgi:anti-anti-sigma regulatory factor
VTVLHCPVDSLWAPEVILAFGTELRGVADRLGPGAQVVLDFSGVETMASAGLGWVIRFWKWVRVERGGEVVFCGLGPWLSEVFRLPGPSIWAIHATRDEAIIAFRDSTRALMNPAGGNSPTA